MVENAYLYKNKNTKGMHISLEFMTGVSLIFDASVGNLTANLHMFVLLGVKIACLVLLAAYLYKSIETTKKVFNACTFIGSVSSRMVTLSFHNFGFY